MGGRFRISHELSIGGSFVIPTSIGEMGEESWNRGIEGGSDTCDGDGCTFTTYLTMPQ